MYKSNDAVLWHNLRLPDISGKKHPSRDILLKLAFGFPLTVNETNHLLYYGNVGSLYPRFKRDAYIMFALHQKYTVIQTNEYLYAHNERTLSIWKRPVLSLNLTSHANIHNLLCYLLTTILTAIAAYQKGLVPILIQENSQLLLLCVKKLGASLIVLKYMPIFYL